jgi:hypothetical protein
MELPFLSHLPPAGADVALERVRGLLCASDEILGCLGGAPRALDAIETVYWFNPLDARAGPVCMVGLQASAPDLDGPLAYSEVTVPVLIRLRFRWSGNWAAAHRGHPIPMQFATTAAAPVNPVPVARTLASWSAAVMRALRADPKLTIYVDGVQLPMASRSEFGPHAFGVEPDGDGGEWYNADTVATYTLMKDFRDGSLWHLRG